MARLQFVEDLLGFHQNIWSSAGDTLPFHFSHRNSCNVEFWWHRREGLCTWCKPMISYFYHDNFAWFFVSFLPITLNEFPNWHNVTTPCFEVLLFTFIIPLGVFSVFWTTSVHLLLHSNYYLPFISSLLWVSNLHVSFLMVIHITQRFIFKLGVALWFPNPYL